jgi:LacI family transcriptional regulator
MAHTTQSDIARKLSVTRITVSKALRDHPDISPEMKQKVQRAAEELGYTPNLIAKNLTSRKTLTLGLVVPDLENSFFAYAADSIIDAAAERNYNVFVTVSRENPRNESLNIQKLVGMRVDGLLVCVSQHTNDRSTFDRLHDLSIPLVFFDREFEGLNFGSVTFDDRNAALAAINIILGEGYTKIAHIAGYSTTSIGRTRKLGYTRALQINGLEINPRWIIEGGFEVEDGYDAFMELYRANDLPEVILAVNDRAALGAYRAAKKVHLNIPQDIGIFAFGFIETAQAFTPALSVINQDPRKLGKTAADLLVATIDNPGVSAGQQVKIEEEFIWSDSLLRRNTNTDTSQQPL